MSRQRREAIRLAEKRSKRIRATLFLVLAAIVLIVLGSSAASWWQSRPEVKTSTASKFAHGSQAELVYEKAADGNQQKLVLMYKQYHGGSTSIRHLLQKPEMLLAYIQHHDLIYRDQVRLYEKFGPTRFRCLVESFTDDKVIAQIRELEPVLAQFEPKISSAAKGDAQSLEQISELLQTGGEGVLRVLSAQSRFAIYLSHQDAAEQAIHGADIPGEKPLISNFFEQLIQLAAKKQEPTDQELQSFMDWYIKTQQEDSKKRHEHIARLIKKYPPGTVVSILIGGSHSGHGARIEKNASEFSLEEILLNSENLALQVYQEQNYSALIQPATAKTLTLSTETSIEDLRKIVTALRAKK